MLLGNILFILAPVAAATSNHRSTIDTDVVIVGGGTSGAYAAVKLSQDYGRKGGHADTWYDPMTKKPFNYGIEVFSNISASVNYFARFNISTKAPESRSQSLHADFRDGALVNQTFDSTEASAAMDRYREQWKRFESIMLPAKPYFPVGDAIPADLLLSWREVARKYNFEAAGPTIWSTTGVDLNTALMIDVWKAYYPGRNGFVAASGDNREIYSHVEKLLGEKVLYETEIVSTSRSNSGVQLFVQHNGHLSTIKAKRLLITIGPETMEQSVFDLTDDEAAIFSSTTGNRYYTGLISHPSLPPATILNTVPEAAVNSSAYPTTPYLASFLYKGLSSSGFVYRFLVIASKETGFEDAKNLVSGSLQQLLKAKTIPIGNSSLADIDRLQFKAFKDHGILYRRWSAYQLRSGIVNRANSLQGLKSTWYTGAFWMNNNAAMLWNTTDGILLQMNIGF
ncbi:uncharacterized protein PpBr36_10105 [Pyricularia pennisetigena]|uniref:uncharacterized protein n=1 Tax=Pyricularia pennisetigena TaxID=1578925 RepID=UPI00114D593D|nr:uncharacterized protein PpBr36_10105 [Pyricularia pennisetigena]TLS22537.1 hypothetical protein PpBr36_10105 [Pyricularia pennisetigena]